MYVGAFAVLGLILFVSVYSGRGVRSMSDFYSGGRRAGTGMVAGAVLSSIVGGASTIGTAQAAYSWGLSAWWFTLGGGLGCLIMALFYAGPLYARNIRTLPQALHREYGPAPAIAATVLTSAGNFLTVCAQVLAGIALITSTTSLGPAASALITGFFMLAYVFFGGVLSSSKSGLVKSALLVMAVGGCAVLALALQGGFMPFWQKLPHERYFSLVARGASEDLGSGLAMIIGIVSTQAYIQALSSARGPGAARAGLCAAALFMPLMGAAGIVVGLYMRLHYPDINPATALPLFVLEKTPPLAAGMILATLFIAIVGTGGGIALGIGSMLGKGLYNRICGRELSEPALLLSSRLTMLAIMAGAVYFGIRNLDSLIFDWSYLSMGLRGAAFAALSAALFMPGLAPRAHVLASILTAPFFLLLGRQILPPGHNPIIFSTLLGILIIAVGSLRKNRPPRGDGL